MLFLKEIIIATFFLSGTALSSALQTSFLQKICHCIYECGILVVSVQSQSGDTTSSKPTELAVALQPTQVSKIQGSHGPLLFEWRTLLSRLLGCVVSLSVL